jgi:hypothetical protein
MAFVKGCSLIALPCITDARGRLVFAEDTRHVPFPIRRIFAIDHIPSGQSRGAHAHRTQHQVVIMLAGACTIAMEAEAERGDVRLNSPTTGLYVAPMVWIELKEFTPDAVCLVLASEHFDETDYIREYDEFKRLARADRR